MNHLVRPTLAAIAISALSSGSVATLAEAKPIDAVARELLAAHGDSVVTLNVVMEITMSMTGQPSRSQEQTTEVPGTIVSDTGWVVTSYSSIQPPLNAPPTSGGVEISFINDIKEVRIIWPDGEESTAKIVFNDPDLDLSIIRPDVDRPSAAVDFSAVVGETTIGILDEIVKISRQDESIDRALRVETGRLSAIIERPRNLFIADIAEPGAPAFHENGAVLGVFTWKREDGQNPAPIIRPAADVAKVIATAMAESTSEDDNGGDAAQDDKPGLTAVGQSILDQYQDSIVSLLTVIDNNGKSREAVSVGAMVSEDGLIVSSRTGIGRGDVQSIKVIFGDGSEVSATMVLEDLDLDLVFLQADVDEVSEQGLEFVVAPFAGAEEAELDAVEPVIMLTREVPAFFRQPKLVATHVDSLINNPRRYYRTPEKQAGALAFDARGQLIGIYARRVNGEETRHRMILPAHHVIEATKRALEAAAETELSEAEPEVETTDPPSE
ncbi:MAG: hypothetical protein ACI9R3_004807 [Verrucomicrobiales bacterium]|jgi:hypothetical protein